MHPERGLIYPDEFIPLAEQTDLIFGLTTWVLEQAVSDLAHEIPDVAVAVNVSARSLANDDFVEQVADCLARHNVEPRRLIVEITETALISDPARTTQVLESLAALGVRTSLDDFGCGQTSLAYVAELPIYELKIDRTFVSDLLTNSGHDAIVRSITNLGHALSFHVIAEGVESRAVATVLADWAATHSRDTSSPNRCRARPSSNGCSARANASSVTCRTPANLRTTHDRRPGVSHSIGLLAAAVPRPIPSDSGFPGHNSGSQLIERTS